MLCFSMICGWAGSKSNLGKAAGAEVAVERRNEKLHAAVARSTFWSQNVQNTACSATFWSCDVEKLHAAVARSTFSSQNAKKLTASDHFLTLRSGKIARRCSEKHICKSKCKKTDGFGPLFEVAMWKNCTPLWREAHLQVNMLKAWGVRTTFWRSSVEKWLKNCTPLWREGHLQVKMY